MANQRSRPKDFQAKSSQTPRMGLIKDLYVSDYFPIKHKDITTATQNYHKSKWKIYELASISRKSNSSTHRKWKRTYT